MSTIIPTPMITPMLNRAIQMGARDLYLALGPSSVDLIVTDPPYGIKYKTRRRNRRNQARQTRGSFGPDLVNFDWLAPAYNALKEGGALYLFTHWKTLGVWLEAVRGAGFKDKPVIVWDKLHWTSGDLRYYGNQTEVVIFAIKGAHELRWGQREGNVWRVPTVSIINNEGNWDNPTQKPEELIRKPIELSSDVGQVVVDSFCGSGTTAAVCKKLGRNFYTSDISAYQVEMANKRLSQITVERENVMSKPKTKKQPIQFITGGKQAPVYECPVCHRQAEKGYDPNTHEWRAYHYTPSGQRVSRSDYCTLDETLPPMQSSIFDLIGTAGQGEKS